MADAGERPRHFVRVAADGTHLELHGKPWCFAGANCHYLMTRAADPSLRPEVLQVLDAMQAAGLTVLRTWAFSDGAECHALQPSAGQFDEGVFRALDWVIAAAGKRGLRVLLALTNHWEAYGGLSQYVRWSCERRGVAPAEGGASRPEHFYGDRQCQDAFQNWLVTITARVNTLTGVAYRDDPTILGWELINEARCTGDYSASILEEWVARVGEFFKALDPWHLLTLGSEGFLGSSTPGLMAANPFDALSLGCDFLRCHALPCIDFCSLHLWPDTWLPGCTEEAALRFTRRWLAAHVELCTSELGKPLLLTEFGRKEPGRVRAAFYEQVYDIVLAACKARQALSGSCLWGVAALPYPDYDGFTVYLDRPARTTSDLGELREEPPPLRRLSWDEAQAQPQPSPRGGRRARRQREGRRPFGGPPREAPPGPEPGRQAGAPEAGSAPESLSAIREAGEALHLEHAAAGAAAAGATAEEEGQPPRSVAAPAQEGQLPHSAGAAALPALPEDRAVGGGEGSSEAAAVHTGSSRPDSQGLPDAPAEEATPQPDLSVRHVDQPSSSATEGAAGSHPATAGPGQQGDAVSGEKGEPLGDPSSPSYRRLSSGITLGAAAQMFEDAADPSKWNPRDDETVALIRQHAAEIAKLNHPSSQACSIM